ncbi:MAG TPA: hypothetical protein VII28_05720 [Puia sp.]
MPKRRSVDLYIYLHLYYHHHSKFREDDLCIRSFDAMFTLFNRK